MALWSPHDPHGVATLRKVLLTLAVASVVFGIYRNAARDDPLVPFLVAAAIFLVVGLFLEAAMDRIGGGPRS